MPPAEDARAAAYFMSSFDDTDTPCVAAGTTVPLDGYDIGRDSQ